jgi:hypothetical protein
MTLNFYKLKTGREMGSPTSQIIAEIFHPHLQNITNHSRNFLSTSRKPINTTQYEN